MEDEVRCEQLINDVKIRLVLELLHEAPDHGHLLVSKVSCHLCPVELRPAAVDLIADQRRSTRKLADITHLFFVKPRSSLACE